MLMFDVVENEILNRVFNNNQVLSECEMTYSIADTHTHPHATHTMYETILW